MKWFGETWHAPICEDDRHVETPVGQSCFECHEPITERDHGLIIPYLGKAADSEEPWHLDCFMRSIHDPDDGS